MQVANSCLLEQGGGQRCSAGDNDTKRGQQLETAPRFGPKPCALITLGKSNPSCAPEAGMRAHGAGVPRSSGRRGVPETGRRGASVARVGISGEMPWCSRSPPAARLAASPARSPPHLLVVHLFPRVSLELSRATLTLCSRGLRRGLSSPSPIPPSPAGGGSRLAQTPQPPPPDWYSGGRVPARPPQPRAALLRPRQKGLCRGARGGPAPRVVGTTAAGTIWAR